MKYANIQTAVFLNRPNRFIANVLLDGKEETVHVKNTGRCKELLIPGCTVYLEKSANTARKTAFDLIAVEKTYSNKKNLLVNIDSQAPNKVVFEWLKTQGYSTIKPEYTFGKSRLDFYLEKEGQRFLMEVKGCTLEIDGKGFFPDAPTERGIKHIQELISAQELGYKGILAFVIQMEGIYEVLPNEKTHPEFAQIFYQAEKKGIEVVFLCCSVLPQEITITQCIRKSTK